MESLAHFDSLTGMHDRLAILSRLNREIKNARRYNRELSLLLLDIDHFGRIKDQCGHLAGDRVLEELAALLQRNIRRVDVAGYYGGGKFIIILPRTGLLPALSAAERIREVVEVARIKYPSGNVVGITVSQGLSSYKADENEYSLMSCADSALYRAKENGRNRVEVSLYV